MIVVSDTSPIRALAFLDHLPILEQLFTSVVIPPAVVDELGHPARLAHGESVVALSQFLFIEVRSPIDRGRVGELENRLDRGESEAIILAQELDCMAVLMDEAAGRQEAIQRGLVPIGTAGILLRAKRAGFLGKLRPLLDRLCDDLGFFLAEPLRHRILDEAGE